MFATVMHVRSRRDLMFNYNEGRQKGVFSPLVETRARARARRRDGTRTHQDELEQRRLIHLDELRVERLLLVFGRLRLLAPDVILAVLDHLRQDLGRDVRKRDGRVHTGVCGGERRQGAIRRESRVRARALRDVARTGRARGIDGARRGWGEARGKGRTLDHVLDGLRFAAREKREIRPRGVSEQRERRTRRGKRRGGFRRRGRTR
eukprot:31197-Pelagococcus_subviridis.AAC.24